MSNNEKNSINESIDKETNQQQETEKSLKVNKFNSLFTLILLTAFSYFALILIDNSQILENSRQPTESKESGKSGPKQPLNSVTKGSREGEKVDHSIQQTNELNNSTTAQPSKTTTVESTQWKIGKYQVIALESLALIFNISFVLGLSGMILNLLSKSGISFVDKLIEKIIENAMGSGTGGASSFFLFLRY